MPVATGWHLRRVYKSGLATHHKVRKHWLFIMYGYRPEWCFWETVVTLRKFALAAATATLGGGGDGHQAFVAILVLAVCLAAQLWAQPYADPQQGALDTASLVVCSLSLYLGLLFVLSGDTMSEAGRWVCSILLVAINAGFVLFMVVAMWQRRARARRAAAAAALEAKAASVGFGHGDGDGVMGIMNLI